MTTPNTAAPTKRRGGAKGEPFVWATAMALTIGLALVCTLLTVVVRNGLAVFWPKRVTHVTVASGSSARLNGADAFAGEHVFSRQKTARNLDKNAEPGSESQFFLGNKDVYGLSFRFIDNADIENTTYPPNILRIERTSYGYAFGTPEMLRFGDGSELSATSPAFNERLEAVVHEVNERRKQIHNIEKDKIGRINHTLERLRLSKRRWERLERAGKPVDQQAVAALDERISAATADYEKLAAEAKALRQQQTEHHLILRIPTGETRSQAIGDIIHYYAPNQLTLTQRAMLFARNVGHFIADAPREANTEGGVFPAIFGTFVMTVLMSLLVTPFGVVTAIYLHEYAKAGFAVRAVRIAINNLAGVPSIVFGVFGLGFFVYLCGGTIDQLLFSDRLPTPTFGTGGLMWASLTLALLTVPVVTVASEEALSAVPRGMREGSLACGATKWQTIQRVVLPAAAPGILTGVILAMARGASEVAPLMLVGVVKLAPTLPLNTTFPYAHFEQKFMHLAFHIYDLGFQSPDSEAAKPMVFATTLLLIAIVVLLNTAGIVIREHLRRKYSTGAF